MSKQNILIVDDDETILEIVKKTLEENNYTHIAATNGKEALEKLAENDNIDAIILDIMMPEMDGRETLKAIRSNEQTKETPILMLTGENMLADLQGCLTAGASDYMVKPFEPSLLIYRLQKILPPHDGLKEDTAA